MPARRPRSTARAVALRSGARTKFTLPALSYDYGALEPVISGQIMEIHHSKHHNTYVTNLNAAVETLEQATAAGDVTAIVAAQGAIKFNGGGHLNHSIFWENLAPPGKGGGGEPEGGEWVYLLTSHVHSFPHLPLPMPRAHWATATP